MRPSQCACSCWQGRPCRSLVCMMNSRAGMFSSYKACTSLQLPSRTSVPCWRAFRMCVWYHMGVQHLISSMSWLKSGDCMVCIAQISSGSIVTGSQLCPFFILMAYRSSAREVNIKSRAPHWMCYSYTFLPLNDDVSLGQIEYSMLSLTGKNCASPDLTQMSQC